MAEEKYNPWMVATVVLAVALVAVFLFFFARGPAGARELTAEEAKNKTIEYINSNLVQPGTRALPVSVEDAGSVYRVTTLYQGQRIPVYITKDGTYLFSLTEVTEEGVIRSWAINTTRQLASPTATAASTPVLTRTPLPTPTPQIKAEDLKQFINCLNSSGFKIYGATWCGYCKQLVEMLGGYDMVKPIYVECTVEKEECTKADIRAYPTIMINGTRYQGDRTFEAFSKATGCPVPPGA